MKSEFGKKLRYYRLKVGMTQKELSERLGYKTSSSIAKIEDGTNDIPVTTAQRIAKVLGIDVMSFIEPLPNDDEFEPYHEYLPYLAKADDVTLRNIRAILGMPMENKKSEHGDCTRTASC